MTNVSLNIPVTNDNIFEDNEQYDLSINSVHLPYFLTVGDIGQAMVTIIDDDGKLLL